MTFEHAADAATEVWRPVVGSLRYEISDQGRIRNAETDHLLRPQRTAKGYLSVMLHDAEGDQRTVLVHRLVAAAFIGPSNGRPVVRHLDGNPSNNTVGNLAWATYSDNNFDTVRHGHHHKAIVTRCPYWHDFDETNTGLRPEGHRYCRACQGIRNGLRRAAKKAALTGAREVRIVSRDVQYVIEGAIEIRPELLQSIDRVARELDAEPGWRIQVEIDPGIRIVASPAPQRPSEAPLTPQDGSGVPTETPDPSDGRTA
jgi:hypothetical protein